MVIAESMTVAMTPATWITMISIVAVWVGTLVWWSGKMTAYREKTESDVAEIRKQNEALTKLIAETKTYNELHYLSRENFDTYKEDICRRINALEDVKFGERLASIEGNQKTQADTLFQIQTTLAEIQKYLRK